MIEISIANQTLRYLDKTYPISSAKNGIGEVEGSYCTPTGRFNISEKIGVDLETGSVLVAREPTGEIFSKELFDKNPDRDWILTRILWLEGLEVQITIPKIVIFIFTDHLMKPRWEYQDQKAVFVCTMRMLSSYLIMFKPMKMSL